MYSDDTPTPTPTKDRSENRAADEAAFPNIQEGRYEFISILGTGGAGTVYQALDTVLSKEVAIKKLHRTTEEQAVRFQREAKLAGALKHENVMSARDFGVTDQDEPYLILDYVEGESLARYLRKVGSLPVEEALKIVIQIASGLEHAHKHGVVHRDIKPNNIVLVNDESSGQKDTVEESVGGNPKKKILSNRIVKIVDFGLAKSIHEDQGITKAGSGLGTPKYMSPEHVRGVDVDERSDIYSLV